MRKATLGGPAHKKGAACQSLDMHPASQPSRSETRLTLDYTPGALLTILRGARISMSLTHRGPANLTVQIDAATTAIADRTRRCNRWRSAWCIASPPAWAQRFDW